MNKFKICLFIFSLWSANLFSQALQNPPAAPIDKDLRTLVTLLEYISKDYTAAVEQGKVINEFEFAEMNEFAEKCISLQKGLAPALKIAQFNELRLPLIKLSEAVSKKADKTEISAIALDTKTKILGLGILKITPNRYPSLKNGAVLFQTNCVSCHGAKGGGDGILSKSLDPKPTNFLDNKGMSQVSPLQAYNVVKLGVEGTAMKPMEHLSEDEIWDLSYYILSLRHNKENLKTAIPGNLSIDSITKWNDIELQRYLDKSKGSFTVGQIRNYEPERPAPLDEALRNLDLSYNAFKKGDNKLAEQYALTSYLEGVELVENLLNATSPALVRDIERDMIAYRKALQANNKELATEYHGKLTTELASAKSLLAENDYSFAFIYGSALSILLREAFEALLIILIILSVLRTLNVKRAVVAVHAGWISAVLVGVVSWFLVDKLINLSGASRELMEAIGATIAVVVLLFAGVWLHSHSEISKWTKFVKDKINKITETGNWVGLLIFSFIVVFREAFEVVLFLSSLKLNNPDVAGSAINWALLTSTVVIAIVTFIFLKYTKRLPVGKFFKLASYMVMILAVILAGKGIRAFQEAGYISVSPIDWLPTIDLLGIYPNIQTITSQLAVLVIIIYLSVRNKKSEKITAE
ncbi:FTR1 family protein [Sphingobacterium multivorum]|uniref:FTR1 family protein n=1 Tax=Sphingobacterium multivorum TaxID=28454 RepID=UPI000DB17F93|nr:FTR1 family protein [Sphingobacterium multivorum]MBL7761324.1 FTR1 family protein [Sediminibacterium sp.]MBU7570675.1 FTR1 family protein [Flavobacterium sp.]PZO34862.1 MAG: hypothetical protein DCE86_00850 [Flavobacteriaceae bacterium]